MENKKLRLSFNAPVVLGFASICVLVQVLSFLTGGWSNHSVFSVYRSSLADPMTYVRCVCHVFGHSGWSHLINNLMYILLLGPMLEEKYGGANIALIMLVTAAVTGIVNMLIFPNVMLMGASGIAFAMILLASITATEEHTIPVSFILVAILYIGGQVYDGLFAADNISQLSHIIGGAVGSAFGFGMNSLKRRH